MGGSSTPDYDPPGDPPPCPARLTAVLPNPGGVAAGDKLAVVYEPGSPGRAVLVTATGVRLGVVAGVPQLDRFLRCLAEGVAYNASIDKCTDGALTCAIVQAPG
jgi:hypothetical protein